MDQREKELLIIFFMAFFLGISVSYNVYDIKSPIYYLIAILSFVVIILANTIIKNIVAYHYEIDIILKPWSIYRYGFRKDAHFKEPVPMAWLPLFFSLISNAKIWWLAVIQFSARPRPERIAKRHYSYYRKAEITEWDIGMIALSGVVINILIGLISYFLGLNYFAKLNFYYAAWSMVPISNLDGTKILFASRAIWLIFAIITFILTLFAFQL